MNDRPERFPALAAVAAIWPFIRLEGRLIVQAIALTVCLTLIEVTTPVVLGVFLDSLLGNAGGEEAAFLSVLGMRGTIAVLLTAAITGGFLRSRETALSGRIGQNVTARMRDALWDQLQRLPLEYTRERGPGRLLMRFLSDARAVQRLVSEGVVRISQDLLLLTAVVGVLVTINWRMGLTVALSLPVYAMIFWHTNKKIQLHSRDTRKRRTRLSSYLGGRLAGMEVVKAHGRQRAETKRVRNLNLRVAQHGSLLAAAGGRLEGTSVAIMATTGALVLWLASSEIPAGRLTGGQLVAFYALLGLLAPVLHRITIANRYLQESQISIERLTNTLAQAPETLPDENLPNLLVEEGAVIFANVSFSYPDGTRVLEDASLTALRGELVAITGPNGSGKSTLLKMLPRFLNPTSGSILIDGQDTANVAVRSIRSRVGLVLQESRIFEGTLRENVRYGVRSNVPEEQVEWAISVTNLDDLARELPDGWETKLREGRRELSHAERLRVALARTLAVNPPILALDEVGASMDPEAQEELARLLLTLALDRTVIVASNNPSTLMVADRIYWLKDGYVVEHTSNFLNLPE